MDWHGSLDDESVMAGALKLLELLKQQNCCKVLNDNTRITGLWANAAKWGSDVFFPMLYEIKQATTMVEVQGLFAGLTVEVEATVVK